MSQLIPQLQQLQITLQTDERLGSIVLQERIAEVLAKADKITKQKMFIREERRRVRAEAEELEERKNALSYLREADWLPEDLRESTSHSAGKRLKLLVGGMPFEISYSVARRDSGSVLCALTSDIPPIAKNNAQQFVFDRDWWLFRHVVKFLRDGALPDEDRLLAQIYREASFWKLSTLKRAIESNKLHIRSRQNADEQDRSEEWWQGSPSWWREVDKQRNSVLTSEQPQVQDAFMSWWTDGQMNVKGFRADARSTQGEEDNNEDCFFFRTSLSSTWNVPLGAPVSFT